METPAAVPTTMTESAVREHLTEIWAAEPDPNAVTYVAEEVGEGGITVEFEHTEFDCILITIYLPTDTVDDAMTYATAPADDPLPLTSVSPAWADFTYELIDIVETVFDISVTDGLYAHEIVHRAGDPTYPFQTVIDPTRDTTEDVNTDDSDSVTVHYPLSNTTSNSDQ